jgi:hypothetical protein
MSSFLLVKEDNMTLTCRCEYKFEAELPKHNNLRLKKMLSALEEGAFMSVKCPECKTTFIPDMDYIVTISDLEQIFEVRSYLDKHIAEIKKGVSNKKHNRLVFGIAELKEKIYLLRDRLNDIIIEKIKGTFYRKTDQDYRLRYFTKDEDNLIFSVLDPYNNLIGHTKFPFSHYLEVKSSTDLDQELNQYYPGYVSVSEKKNA